MRWPHKRVRETSKIGVTFAPLINGIIYDFLSPETNVTKQQLGIC